MPSLSRPLSVEEFHGPYGPYQVSELVLQKIWLERAFDVTRLRDGKGRKVEIEHPGTWNRLEGPDFKDAVLLFDGHEVKGDVEVHFSQSDWKAHEHDSDPAYDDVVLHVLYYTPSDGAASAWTASGIALPHVSLLPLLWYSLEEYAGEDSLVASTGVDLRPEVEALLAFAFKDRRRRLVEYAQRRWKMKLHYAARRIDQLGWEGACHQSALEVMGFARNRVPMLMIAERYDLESFALKEIAVEALIEVGGERWRFNGCRPANHPKLRLQQYRGVAAERPDWPRRLESIWDMAASVSLEPTDEAWGSLAARQALGVAEVRRFCVEEVLGGKLGGSKVDTLVCDAMLPLCAARSGREAFPLWFHWNAGDGPASCSEALRLLQILEARKTPLSNGWLQGMLGAKSHCVR